MEGYYFLFGLGFLWSIFAAVQDLKTQEISNWLNFSLIAFGLSYRSFYSILTKDGMFFLSGLIGFAVFFVLAYIFYYSRVFAGGDAKLMMGFGVILPYSDFGSLLYMGIFFIISLFTGGAIYSLFYSGYIVTRNFDKFWERFGKSIKKTKVLTLIFFIAGIAGFLFNFYFGIMLLGILLAYLLYIYILALDKCMIRLVDAKDLREGDWLEENVRIGGRWIKKSVHGLSINEIKLLKKARKKTLVKDGIPFSPAFLISLIMVFFFSILGFRFPLAFLS